MLLDPETLALAPGVERLLPAEGLKTELFSCLVETNTPVCETALEARDELVRLRRVVLELAGREGLAVAAAGSHPFSIPEEQRIVEEPRYLKMVDELGAIAKGQLVCGLHVHVGMESFEACLRTLDGIRPWLPRRARALVRTRRTSPARRRARSRRGSSGCGSCRAAVRRRSSRRWPTGRRRSRRPGSTTRESGGTRALTRGSGRSRCGSPTRRRPSTRCRSRARRRWSQALCAAPPEPGARAARAVEPAARELGTWELVELLREPPEALRQLEVGRRDGLEAVAADLVRRSAMSEPPRRALSAPARRRAAGPAQRARRPRRARDRRRRVGRPRRPGGRARRAGPRGRAGDRADPGRPALGPRGLVRRAGAERRAAARARRARARALGGVGVAAADLARPLPREHDRRHVRGPRRRRGSRPLGDAALRPPAAAVHAGALRGAAAARPGAVAAARRA